MTYLGVVEVWVWEEEVEVLGNMTSVLGDFFLEKWRHGRDDVVTDSEAEIKQRNNCNLHINQTSPWS